MIPRYRINGAPGRELKGWKGRANPEQQLPTEKKKKDHVDTYRGKLVTSTCVCSLSGGAGG